MTREEAKEFYPIMQAFADGKEIEGRPKGFSNDFEGWMIIDAISSLDSIEYRIKPEPKYRSFKDAEECWNEMQKHQPFGWLKPKGDDTISKFMLIDSLMDKVVTVRTNVRFKYYELLEHYTFADGTPFGVKVEE